MTDTSRQGLGAAAVHSVEKLRKNYLFITFTTSRQARSMAACWLCGFDFDFSIAIRPI
jgi:hypothetical protein